MTKCNIFKYFHERKRMIVGRVYNETYDAPKYFYYVWLYYRLTKWHLSTFIGYRLLKRPQMILFRYISPAFHTWEHKLTHWCTYEEWVKHRFPCQHCGRK